MHKNSHTSTTTYGLYYTLELMLMVVEAYGRWLIRLDLQLVLLATQEQ
jgi:hypothetical protein